MGQLRTRILSSMTLRRALAIGGGAALVGAWLASAANTRVSAPPARAERAADAHDRFVSDVRHQAERLRERLNAAAVVPEPMRNPFEFGGRLTHPIPAAAPMRSEPAAPIVITEPPAPPPPSLTLMGIAEDGPAAALVRTAMISGAGQLFLAKTGDTVAERFTVKAIGADVVELIDVTDGRTVRLALR